MESRIFSRPCERFENASKIYFNVKTRTAVQSFTSFSSVMQNCLSLYDVYINTYIVYSSLRLKIPLGSRSGFLTSSSANAFQKRSPRERRQLLPTWYFNDTDNNALCGFTVDDKSMDRARPYGYFIWGAAVFFGGERTSIFHERDRQRFLRLCTKRY